MSLLFLSVFVGFAHADIGPYQNLEKALHNHFANTKCQDLPDQIVGRPGNDTPAKLRDVCYGQRAWFEKRASFCDAMSTPERTRHCRGWMIIRLKKPDMCRDVRRKPDETPWIEDKLAFDQRSRSPYFDCLRAYANWTRSPEVCDQIPYPLPRDREECRKTARTYPLWDDRRGSPI